MAVTRANLVMGPARVVFDGAAGVSGSFYTQDSFEVKINMETFDIMTDAHGKIDERAQEVSVEFDCTPEGSWTLRNVPGLWPYASSPLGTSIFGTADKYIKIHCSPDASGEIHTIVAGAITKMPSLILGATKTMIGSVTFAGVRAATSDWNTPSSVYMVSASGAVFASTSTPIVAANIIAQPYAGFWTTANGWGSGAATVFASGFQTETGWVIDFELGLTNVEVDAKGIIDMRVANVGVMARCIPLGGPTVNQVLATNKFQASGGQRGLSLSDASADLTIIGQNAVVPIVLKNAVLKTQGFRFGSTVLRQGEVGFVSMRGVDATGGLNPLWVMATA